MNKVEIFNIADLLESNGKTMRENNNALKHKIEIGTLVEVIPWDSECEWGNMRMYVTKHTRDCDGTPLYSLGSKTENCAHGFSDDTLKLVEDSK